MTEIRIPSDARCQVGSVALIVRGRTANIGKLVVVTAIHRWVEYPSWGAKALFCWKVEGLQQTISCDAGERWDGHTPDISLLPVGSMAAAKARALVVKHAEADFQVALKDLATVFQQLEAERERNLKLNGKAVRQFELEWLLQVVPTREVFEEVGFTLDSPDGNCLSWNPECQGIALKFGVGPAMFDGWYGSAAKVGIRNAMFAELWFAQNMVRGEVMLRLASAWKEAFQSAQLPAGLTDAATFEEFKRTKRLVNPGCPRMIADGKFSRFILGRLRRHFESDLSSRVTFTMTPGQMEVRFGDQVLHCPAKGMWFGEASVDLAHLMMAIPRRFSHGIVSIEFDGGQMRIDGVAMLAVWADADAAPHV